MVKHAGGAALRSWAGCERRALHNSLTDNIHSTCDCYYFIVDGLCVALPFIILICDNVGKVGNEALRSMM